MHFQLMNRIALQFASIVFELCQFSSDVAYISCHSCLVLTNLIIYVLPPGKGNLAPAKVPRIPKKGILVSKPVLVSGGHYRTSKKSTLSQHWSALNTSGN